MKRRFLVAIEGFTSQNDSQFIEFFRTESLGWWHHISGFWLIFDRDDKITASEIRDKIKQINSISGPSLVMQIEEDVTWAGLNRPGKNNTFDWLKKSWPDS